MTSLARPTRRTVSPVTYRRITFAALLAQAFIIVTGAAVRLTGSGLGCSDWPTCEEESLVAPLEYHALIEFGNRLVTFLVLATVVAAIWGARRRDPFRPDLLRWSLGLLAGVVAQVLLGGITVLTHLWPPVVMGHFLLSMVLVWNAVVLHHRAGHDGSAGVDVVSAPTRTGITAIVVLGAVVVFSGTLVTGTGPHGGDETVERLPLDLPQVARAHAVLVWILLAVIVTVLVRLAREGAPRPLWRAGQWLLVAVVVQGAIGYVQYANGVPVELVALHIVGSILVWGTIVKMALETRRRPGVGGDPSPRHGDDTALVGT